MTDLDTPSSDRPEPAPGLGISRRRALGLLGVAGTGAAALPLLGTATASAAGPALHVRADQSGATPVQGLHLQFGADPASQMVVSWITAAPVGHPRVLYGTAEGGYGATVTATTRSYVDGTSQRTVYVHHATLTGLRPDTEHVYAAQHDGAAADGATFRTAPRGRAPFTFTSFGDQSVPQTSWAADGTVGLNALSSPASGDIVTGVEQVAPLFHLMNGDLCYANLDVDRVRTWNGWFTNNARSTRNRPWMPAAGNHEIEKGNGPIGFGAFQTYFQLPSTETDAELRNLYYAFTVGGVRVIVLENDDNALQDGGDHYVRGYSGGRQLAWLRTELAAARRSTDVDWIVVCMHQVMISSADFNGIDLGLRAVYGPLFAEFQVDLVVCGHEHHYERSLAVRGVVPGTPTLTPAPGSTATDVIDTSHGTVHMVLGGGGTSATSNQDLYPAGKAKVIIAVSRQPGANGKRTPTYEFESTPWLGVRDAEHPYGFAAFTVDPGRGPGDLTALHVTYYNVLKPTGELSVFEKFTLQRRRSDSAR